MPASSPTDLALANRLQAMPKVEIHVHFEEGVLTL